MSKLVLRGIRKTFGAFTAVDDFNLEMANGEFVSLLGPSGCGKTTTLRMIAGFMDPTAGVIEMDGRVLSSPAGSLPPERRQMSMIFQSYAVWPNMTVEENVAFGLKLRKLSSDEVRKRTREMLDIVQMGHLAERYPAELSGGQQQRVAVARALVMEPPVVLLDEPFGALDLKLRHAMQDELQRIHREVGGTFVFVTHDQTEALALANRIAVMNEGRLEQIGTPEEMYLRPATRFVAQFIGEANVLAGTRRGGTVTTASGLRLSCEGADADVVLVIRPEHARLTAKSAPGQPAVTGVVDEATFFGSHVRYGVMLASGERMNVHAPLSGPPALVGQSVAVAWDAAMQRVLSV